MTTNVCNAKDKNNCPHHPIAEAPLTLAEQVAANNLKRDEERKRVLQQEWIERSSDWGTHGFQKIHETRSGADYSDYYTLSKNDLESRTEDEKKTFKFYSSNNFRWVNNYLYSPNDTMPEGNDSDRSIYDYKIESLSQQEVEQAPTKRQAQEAIQALDKALLHTEQDARILYRGQSVAAEHLRGKTPVEVHAYVDATYKVGGEVNMRGYTSATPSALTAMRYSIKEDNMGGKPEGILFEMKTKKGVNITSASLYMRESETLIPRDTKWKVVAVHKSKIIKAESVNMHVSSIKSRNQAKVTLIQLVEIE